MEGNYEYMPMRQIDLGLGLGALAIRTCCENQMEQASSSGEFEYISNCNYCCQ